MIAASGSCTLTSIKLEDVLKLEEIFAKPTVVDDQLVYVLPDWLVHLRQVVETRDMNQ